jgi:NTP pyrophosphatase (non-canonical NTP hydrolase)
MTFSERNLTRCENPNGFNHKLDSWSLSDWMTALTGEVGEAANIIKKLNRIRDGVRGNNNNLTETQLREDLAEELADVAIYLDLLAQAAGFDLDRIREDKFKKTSEKIGYHDLSLKPFYIHRNSGNAVFVKEGGYFIEQGGLREKWGEAWKKVMAIDLRHAREIAEKTLPLK